jgi:hypothetical protein
MSEFIPPKGIKVSMVSGESPALLLTVDPGASSGDALTVDCLRGILAEYGAEGWLIDHEQVRLLKTERSSLKASKCYRVAERRDAQVLITFSEDHREARMTILLPHGGTPASAERILAELKKAGVNFGVFESKIPELAALGSCENVLIARANPPMPGTDVAFEPLVKESEHKGHPGIGADGSVDLHDLGLFISIAKGTPLLKRIPPTPGIPGVGLDGGLIPPPKPRDRALMPGAGAVISSEDPNILIAGADGLPVVVDNTARVISRLDLDGLDYQTGNVEFVGSMLIRGPIQPGFRAKAGGDIVANDTVDASELTAGGSIQLSCGVFGRGRSYLSAKGNIKARFLSDCTVYCGGNLEVEDLIANCTIICEGVVEAGQRWGKGQIYGGKIRATRGIRARILGSVMEVSTLIEVTSSPSLAARERILVAEIESLQHRADELGRSLAYLHHAADGRADPRTEPMAHEHRSVLERLEALKEELEHLTARLRVPCDAKISADRIYPGVTIAIGIKRELITEAMDQFVCRPIPEGTISPAEQKAAGLNRSPAKSTA